MLDKKILYKFLIPVFQVSAKVSAECLFTNNCRKFLKNCLCKSDQLYILVLGGVVVEDGEVVCGGFDVGGGPLSGINVPIQNPLGTSEMFVTSSELIVPLVSIGSGWISSRPDLISSSSTWCPSCFGTLNVNQSLQ